jgi:hypothetical protein
MTDYHVSRDPYHDRPMYAFKGMNVTQEDYVQAVGHFARNEGARWQPLGFQYKTED